MAYCCSNYLNFKRSYVHGIIIYATHRQPVDTDVCQEVLTSIPNEELHSWMTFVCKKRMTKGPNTFIEREFNDAVELHRCIASMCESDYNDRARV
jgi:hypothetical protein